MFAELNGYITANDYEQYQLAVTDLFKGRWMSLVALVIYCVFIGYRIFTGKACAQDGKRCRSGSEE